MPHERTLVRNAVVAQLMGETAAEDRVTKSRIEPNAQAQLPAISVYSNDETSKDGESSPRELERKVDVEVVGWVRAATGESIDDVLDDLALEIETAMDSDRYLGATAGDSVLVSTKVGLANTGDRPMGAVVMTYRVTYRSDLRVDDASDVFDTASVNFSLGSAQATDDQASDLLEDINQE